MEKKKRCLGPVCSVFFVTGCSMQLLVCLCLVSDCNIVRNLQFGLQFVGYSSHGWLNMACKCLHYTKWNMTCPIGCVSMRKYGYAYFM